MLLVDAGGWTILRVRDEEKRAQVPFLGSRRRSYKANARVLSKLRSYRMYNSDAHRMLWHVQSMKEIVARLFSNVIPFGFDDHHNCINVIICY